VNIPPLPIGWRRTCAGSGIGRARRVRRHFKDCRAHCGECAGTAREKTRKPDRAAGAPPPPVSELSGGVCQPAVCVCVCAPRTAGGGALATPSQFLAVPHRRETPRRLPRGNDSAAAGSAPGSPAQRAARQRRAQAQAAVLLLTFCFLSLLRFPPALFRGPLPRKGRLQTGVPISRNKCRIRERNKSP